MESLLSFGSIVVMAACLAIVIRELRMVNSQVTSLLSQHVTAVALEREQRGDRDLRVILEAFNHLASKTSKEAAEADTIRRQSEANIAMLQSELQRLGTEGVAQPRNQVDNGGVIRTPDGKVLEPLFP